MKTTMKTTVMILLMMGVCGTVCHASDFWRIYGEKFTYNYSIKTGSIPDAHSPAMSARLSNAELTSIITKTFSQSLSMRFKQISRRQRPMAFVCIFSAEPEKCFFQNVMSNVFDEVNIVKAPSFSNKIFKKLNRHYSYTMGSDSNRLESMSLAAEKVPAGKKFNPRFGIDTSDLQVVVMMPFRSYFGSYVEPKYGVKSGASLSLIVDKYFLDFEKEGVTLRYRVAQRENSRGYVQIYVRPEGEIFIANEFMFK